MAKRQQKRESNQQTYKKVHCKKLQLKNEQSEIDSFWESIYPTTEKIV